MHVYKTVEAEGFYGVVDMNYWLQRGFKWIESSARPSKYIRGTLKEGKLVVEKVGSLLSEYEYVLEPVDVLQSYFERNREVVRHREKREVLGEIIYFHIYRGWADRTADFGLTFIPPICWHGPPPEHGGERGTRIVDFISSTVRPLSQLPK